MTRRMLALLFAFTAGAIVGHVAIPSAGAQAQTHKPMFMTRLYTGPDNQTHSEEVEVKFDTELNAVVIRSKPAIKAKSP